MLSHIVFINISFLYAVISNVVIIKQVASINIWALFKATNPFWSIFCRGILYSVTTAEIITARVSHEAIAASDAVGAKYPTSAKVVSINKNEIIENFNGNQRSQDNKDNDL